MGQIHSPSLHIRRTRMSLHPPKPQGKMLFYTNLQDLEDSPTIRREKYREMENWKGRRGLGFVDWPGAKRIWRD